MLDKHFDEKHLQSAILDEMDIVGWNKETQESVAENALNLRAIDLKKRAPHLVPRGSGAYETDILFFQNFSTRDSLTRFSLLDRQH